MRLYYSPGACSLAPHIVLRETKASFSLTKVDTKSHRLEDGTDYYTIAPKGQVPVLELRDGTRISEGPIVSQYIADQMEATSLLPATGTLARIRVLEWCNYLTSEIHKSFTPIFHAYLDQASTEILKGILKKKLVWLNSQLEGKSFLTGDQFTIADAYLFVLINWTNPIKLDISDLAHVKALHARVAARPAVQEAMKAEGLIG
jgi:glutathione S-transferase